MTKKLKTIQIQGKDYVTVNERLKYFREIYPNYTLDTEIIKLDEKQIIIKAIILDDSGRLIASGIAHEISNSTYINETSFIENAETSSWGRALGNLGIGIDSSVASADEVANAIQNQPNSENRQPSFNHKPYSTKAKLICEKKQYRWKSNDKRCYE